MVIKEKKFLVTGGAGFIGSNLVNALVKKGAYVIAYDDLSRGNFSRLDKNSRLKRVKGSITNKKSLEQIMRGCDYVYHQAALHLKGSNDSPERCISVNVVGSYNVLEAAVNAKVKKIVLASSSSVYGNTANLPAQEDNVLQPNSFYAASKVAMETMCTSFKEKYGLDYTILRYLNVYGPGQHVTSSYTNVIDHFIKKILTNQSPIIHGKGDNTLDLIYIDDVVRANIKALQPQATNQIYNIGTGKEISVNGLYRQLKTISGSPSRVIKKSSDNDLIKYRSASVRKAKKGLGFTAKVTLDAGLKQVFSWYKELKK